MIEKFTPGEWVVSKTVPYMVGVEGADDFICDNIGIHDANLIAAAPELYRAVKELAEHLDLQEGYEPYDSAIKLLKKARGEPN